MQRSKVSNIITSNKLPNELTVHGRQPRGFSEKSHFKAHEYLNYLFFVAPIAFRSVFEPDSLQYLSFGCHLVFV